MGVGRRLRHHQSMTRSKRRERGTRTDCFFMFLKKAKHFNPQNDFLCSAEMKKMRHTLLITPPLQPPPT